MRVVGAALLVVAIWGGPGARALESDQYYAWGRELADATDVLNAKVVLEIDLALEEINAGRSAGRLSCHQVIKRIIPRFRTLIFADLELWATNSALVPRIPGTPEEELEYRKRYIYRNSGPLDLGTKVPPSPTIELAGVRLGTDKLTHFFSEGWMYYNWYRKYERSGMSPEEAERRAIKRGIGWERTILGLVSSGVFSMGDLEANYQGMHFLLGLCQGDEPGLRRSEEGWRYAGDFEFRDYVTPEWDESYQSPVFGKSRWKKVRPCLIEYCPMLDDPSVVRRREAYAERDRLTLTERIVAERVARGKLADPSQFALENNCPEKEPESRLRAEN